MQIKQFEDKNLAHYSYAVLSDGEKKLVLIDPARNTQPYLDFAKEHDADIVGIIETHPHADFISSHQEFHETLGVPVYTSKDVHAFYPHQSFDEGQSIEFGEIKLSAINTPGHSPDSISILAENDGKQTAVFTGDTLFIGDCGRPDLREGVGNVQSKREVLAKQMYHSLRNKIMVMNDDTLVYPAHGAGTLCGKKLSTESSSTVGKEKKTNWSLQESTEEEFVQNLLADQPFIPAYFSYDVDLNRKGAAPYKQSMAAVQIGKAVKNEMDAERLNKETWIVDARPGKNYKKGHLPLSVNLMEDKKFETWLGSIIQPGEPFYLTGEDTDQIQRLIGRAAAIGYELQIKEAFTLESATEKEEPFNIEKFKQHPEDYTIVDVRNTAEVKDSQPFQRSLSIPLGELRSRVDEIPIHKPIVVHCAGGYRSAAASSIIQSTVNRQVLVFDLGEAIKDFY